VVGVVGMSSPNHSSHLLRQVRIIHFSDIHFGPKHQFAPPIEPDGSRGAARGNPPLLEFVRKDLAGPDFEDVAWRPNANIKFPLIAALTGDLTESADQQEFEQALAFTKGLADKPLLGTKLTSSEVFVVPGNHDVVFTEPDAGRRWYPYCDFYEQHAGFHVKPKEAFKLTRVIDRSHDLGLVIAEINSCFDVRKGAPGEKRGEVDSYAIAELETQLRAVPVDSMQQAIKVALIHHHPVVLPQLADAGGGYDAIAGARYLLDVLHQHRFHLLLHGHKHYPHTFSYDPVCAWSGEDVHPLLVVAGGSAGAIQNALPSVERATNTYNVISLKWNPNVGQGRIRIVTRGLQRSGPDGRPAPPAKWHFRTLRVDDRAFSARMPTPEPGPGTSRPFNAKLDGALDLKRKEPRTRLRGNMPVVEVLPSLNPAQAYEARVWIARTQDEHEEPVRVVWSAGPNFHSVFECVSADNPDFCTSFAYWGPVPIQARIYFSDGKMETETVFARLPGYERSFKVTGK
jgi:3',5'-cyclic AMP phosphodiesterase CpdA